MSESDLQLKIVFLIIGSIATGFAFNWVVGIAAFFLFGAVLPVNK